jgi:predicted AAA+ superfamily ATPase
MKNISESLAGRVGIIRMQGFSHTELKGYEDAAFEVNTEVLLQKAKVRDQENLESIYKRIFRGSMPGIYSRNIEPEIFYSGYVNTYIQRDINDLTQVADELLFLQFLTACAARTSQMLNLSDIAGDIGISAPTAKQWLSILVTSGIVMLLESYQNNRLKRVIVVL